MERSGRRIVRGLLNQLDSTLLLLYFAGVVTGLINIYAAVYDPETERSFFDLTINSGKQFVWICCALAIALFILLLDVRLYVKLAYPAYGAILLMLVGVLLFGREIAGSKSWFDLGFMRFQPSELAKVGTVLALARFLSDPNTKLMRPVNLMTVLLIIAAPAILTLLQGDTGSALVFASLSIMLYREGLPGQVLALGLMAGVLLILTLVFKAYLFELMLAIAGCGILYIILFNRRKWKQAIGSALLTALAIAVVFSVDFFVYNVLKPHQQKRIEVLINPNADVKGVGWQVNQSKIAIGSGGFSGKGFLEGTQTKFKFVPDQSTDFIFCTIAEEYGWLGSLALITFFAVLLNRLIVIAERQKSRFTRVYAYGAVSILFFHFAVNIGMTIGLFPVIGIPLPFFSYGGSSLWSFTILLFILLKLDMHRKMPITSNFF
ncbi:MAG: rod shape-determining protein RodA [Cytophagales bacterium]|nr:rod shape-determining protein RodA [Bernardetiaceae bacterium]MDW8203747.1 rod shape-determining protein RodA [Cytophagales bacterium]